MNKTRKNLGEEKRGKMLVLAGVLALAMFLSKITQTEVQLNYWRIYLNASIYFVIAFIGLLWLFNLHIKKKSLIFLFQSSLYIFSQSLFIEFFFFQKFNRIYEAIILLILIILAFLGNYMSFLMANVLNVDLFKKIPLAQVGRTSSYLFSLLMMYFFTFSFLVSGIKIYFLLPLIFVIYSLVVFIHYFNIGVVGKELYRRGILTVLVPFILFLGMFLTGDSHEIVAVVPVLGYYFSVGVVSREVLMYEYSKFKGLYFHIFLLIIAFLIALFLNFSF